MKVELDEMRGFFMISDLVSYLLYPYDISSPWAHHLLDGPKVSLPSLITTLRYYHAMTGINCRLWNENTILLRLVLVDCCKACMLRARRAFHSSDV